MKEGSGEKLTDEDRRQLLSKTRSTFFWVGKRIPETELVEGEKVELRKVVFNYIANKSPTEEEMKGALSLATCLQRKVKEMETRLREEEMTVAEAENLLEHMLGLMRGIDALKRHGGKASEVRMQALMSKMDDQRRWINFVRSLR